MKAKTSYLALADTLESAESGTRDLDRAVYEAWSGKSASYATRGYSGREVTRNHDVPRYTTRLDDAMSLVNDADEYSISTLYGVARVELPLNDGDFSPEHGEHKGGDVKLAFCAAALRLLARRGRKR